MVQQPAGWGEQPVERLEVLGHPLAPHVLEHPDGRDGVELLAPEVAVVLQADLDLPVQPGIGHPSGGLVDLLAAEGDADHPGAVVAGGVDGHRTPTTAHVEQPGSGGVVNAQLAADQLVLGRLGLLERGAGRREPRAGVGHARAQHESVEAVSHVVVVADGLGVPGGGVESSGRPALLGGRGQRRTEHAQAPGRLHHGGHGPQTDLAEVAGRRVVERAQQLVEVAFDGEVAGDEGAGHAQLARRPQDATDGVGRSDPQGADGRPAGPTADPSQNSNRTGTSVPTTARRKGARTAAALPGLGGASLRSEPAARGHRGSVRTVGLGARQLGDHDRLLDRVRAIRPHPILGLVPGRRVRPDYSPVRAEIWPDRTARTSSSKSRSFWSA